MNGAEEIIKIKQIPQLPKEIIDAYNHNALIVFVGAGISRLMGCDGWIDMSNKLIKSFFSPSECNLIINNNFDQITKITMAKQRAIKDNKEDDFWEIFEDSIKPKNNEPNKPIDDVYDTICQLRLNFITTNCDGLLADKFPFSNTTACTEDAFVKHNYEPFVYCIHGDYKTDKDSLVFTIDQYLNAYRNGSDLVKFLQKAMSENTVLFLGYGLTEFQIMSAAFNKESNTKHFLLDGFFDYEQDYVNALDLYYKQVGVQLIPYSKDKKDYKQQIDIIKNWVDELRTKSTYSSRLIQSVITDANGFNDKNKDDIKKLINRDSPNRSACLKAFLNELKNSSVAKEWIEFLITSDLVSLSDVLSQGKSPVYDNYKLWDFLNCLINSHKNKKIKYGDSAIIDNYIYDVEHKINSDETYYLNFNLIRQCVELLLERRIVPSKDELDLFKIFIETSYDNGYYEISNNINNIKTWPADIIIDIFQYIYTRDDENRSYYHYYDTYLLVKKTFGKKIINKLFNIVINRFVKKEDTDGYFYKSIDDRFHLSENEYSLGLKKIIEDLATYDCIKVVKEILKISNNTFAIQLCLHLLTINNINSIDVLNCNPLNTYNTFVDFYYWLNSQHNRLSSDIKDAIADMTVRASFGVKESDDYYLDAVKRINTYKVMILKLIDTDYSKTLINNYPEIYENLLDPISHKDTYYSIKIIENDTDFEEPIETEDVQEMLNLVEDKIKNIEFHSKHEENTILKNLFNKLNDKQKIKLLIYSVSSGDFLKILPILNKENTNSISKKSIKSFLYESINSLSDNSFNRESTTQAILGLASIINFLHDINWNPEEIIELSLKIIMDGILKHYIHPELKSEIDITVINDAECIIWNNILQSAQEIKENTTKIELIKNTIEKNKTNQYMVYSLAYKINAVAYIDFNWFENEVLNILKEQNDYRLDLLITFNSRYVIKELTSFLINSDNKKEIIHFLNSNDNNCEFLKRMYITYITNAYSFDYISLEIFYDFLKELQSKYLDEVINSLIFDNNETFKVKVSKLNSLFELYKDNKSISTLFANKTIECLSNLKELNDNSWFVINKYIQVSDMEDYFFVLYKALKKTNNFVEEINEVIETICNKDVGEILYYLDDSIDELIRLDNTNSIIRLCNYAISKGINAAKYSKIIDNIFAK